MSYQEFESEERDDMSEAQERTPGVYVRTNQPSPHELDMLWSTGRLYNKEERSPILFLIGGFVLGILLTSAVFLLFINKPAIQTGDGGLLSPIIEDVQPDTTDTSSAGSSSEQADDKTSGALDVNFATYVVKSGDTLGSIAYKHYGSSAPNYVEKITRANKMKDADTLQIGQKLVIPPKNY